MIRITIYGDPTTTTAQQKGVSMGGRRVKFFTKPEIKAECKRMRSQIVKQLPAKPLDCPIFATVKIVFPLGAAQAMTHVDRLSEEGFVMIHQGKPDVDNSAKLIVDALSDNPKKGLKGAIIDDKQIGMLLLSKWHGSEPRIEITLSELVTFEQAIAELYREVCGKNKETA